MNYATSLGVKVNDFMNSSGLYGFTFEVLRFLGISPSKRLIRTLERRHVDLSAAKILDCFAGNGNTQTRDFASKATSLELWEINPELKPQLEHKFPAAKVKIVDSFEEIKNITSTYDLVILDTHIKMFGDHYEHFDIFPNIFHVLAHSAVVIVNVIPKGNSLSAKRHRDMFGQAHLEQRKKFYLTDKPEHIPIKMMINTYSTIINRNKYYLDWFCSVRRGMIVYYLAMKVTRQLPDTSQESS
jgi:hypothetical protein